MSSRVSKRDARNGERAGCTYRLHGRASGRVGLYEQLRRRLPETSDLSFHSLKKAWTSLRVKRCSLQAKEPQLWPGHVSPYFWLVSHWRSSTWQGNEAEATAGPRQLCLLALQTFSPCSTVGNRNQLLQSQMLLLGVISIFLHFLPLPCIIPVDLRLIFYRYRENQALL